MIIISWILSFIFITIIIITIFMNPFRHINIAIIVMKLLLITHYFIMVTIIIIIIKFIIFIMAKNE